RFNRTVRSISSLNPAQFFHQLDEFAIHGQARLSKRHHRNHPRIFRCGRENSSAGPRSFATWVLPVEERDAQVVARQFQGDRAANQATAGDNRVVGFHSCILSHSSTRMTPGRLALEMPKNGQLFFFSVEERRATLHPAATAILRALQKAPAPFSPGFSRASSRRLLPRLSILPGRNLLWRRDPFALH